jgi:predicted RNA-binding protein YlqC (UPF0109 family)
MNALPHQYAPLFRRFAEGIIYKPSQMIIKELRRPDFASLLVAVHAEDIGILCGAHGKVIKSIQTLFSEIGRQHGDNVRISIDKFGERKPAPDAFRTVDSWDRSGEAVELVEDTLREMKQKWRSIEHHDSYDTTIITVNSDLPKPLFDALDVAMHAWGKSLGRKILLASPDQVVTA